MTMLMYEPQLRAIPTVGGPSLPGLSYLAAWNTMRDCRAILDEGYRKARLPCLPCLSCLSCLSFSCLLYLLGDVIRSRDARPHVTCN